MMIGILTTDAHLIVRSWDERLAEMTGIIAADAIGRHIGDLAPDLAGRGLLARFENVLSQGSVVVLAPTVHHYLLRCPPQQPAMHFDVMQQHVTIAPLRDEDRVAGTIVTVEDLTSQLDQERMLVDQLGDPNWRVRRDTVASLGRTADAGSIAQVLRILRSKHHEPAVLNSALQVLALNRIDVVPALIEFLHDADVDLRVYTALALGYQADQRAETALLAALHDPQPNVGYHVIESLGRLRAQAAVEQLVVFATSGDFFLAFPALTALTQIGDSRVAERLLPLLDDEILCEAATDALSELGDLAVVTPLARLLNQEAKPAAIVCRALVNLYERYHRTYGQAGYIVHRVRRAVETAAADRLIALLDTADEHDLRPLARVLGWLDGSRGDAALCALLRRDTLRDDLADICVQRGAQIVAHLLELLAAGDLETRAVVIDILGRIGHPSATPALIVLLASEPELAGAAAEALTRAGDRSAFEPLLALLGHPDSRVRQTAIAAINSLGHPDSLRRLPVLMRDPDPLVRESAVRIAGYHGYPESTSAVLASTADADERVRMAAIEQLPLLQEGSVLPVLLAALRQDTPRVRAAAARAGGWLDETEVGVALVTALSDPAPWVRYNATRSLAQRGESMAFEPLARIIETDPAPHVRIAALEAIGALGHAQAVDLLAMFVSAEDLDVACAALAGLGATHAARALPILRSAVRSPEPRRRVAAIPALAEHGGAEVVEVLQWVAATERDPAIAAVALAALAGLRSPQSIAALIGLLAKPSQRQAVCDALASLGAGEVERIAPGLQHPDPGVRRAVVEVLARMRQRSTLGLLEATLDDPDVTVRLAAVQGLAGLTSQDAATILRRIATSDHDPHVQRVACTLLER